MIDYNDFLQIWQSKLDNIVFKKVFLGYNESDVLEFIATMCEEFDEALNQALEDNNNLKEEANSLRKENKRLKEENARLEQDLKLVPYKMQALTESRDKYKALCEKYEMQQKMKA